MILTYMYFAIKNTYQSLSSLCTKSCNKVNKIGVILLLLHNIVIHAQYSVEKLGPKINSDQYDEISPVVTRDGRTLYFTRIGAPDFNRTLIQDEKDLSKTLPESQYSDNLKSIYSQIAESKVLDPVSSSINQDIWVADSKSALFDQVLHPGFPLNSALPNSVCSLSPQDNRIVTINHFAKDGSMFKGFSYMDRKSDGSFSFPDPIYINDFHSNNPVVNISMSKDGDVIILSLDRPGGIGDADLYVSFKLKQDLWSEPLNMGPMINSSYRDITPYLSEDKSKLFFASNRPGGPGGVDIYVSNRIDYTWTNWSSPSPLAAPINSASDDSNPAYVESSECIFFISRRDGTSDIFKADIKIPSELERPITLRGTIRHSLTKEPIGADLYYGPSKQPLSNVVAHSEQGVFEISIDKKDIYRLAPKKPGFIGKNQIVDATILAQGQDLIYEIDFFMSPMIPELNIELNNIYFERGLPVVKQESYVELDKLASVLIKKTSIHIRIDGHTDSVGKFNELLDLSLARAEGVKKYLVSVKGIDTKRITTKGHGGRSPIVPNYTDESRAKNRRVEVYVTNPDGFKSVRYRDVPDPQVRVVKAELPSNEILAASNTIGILKPRLVSNHTRAYKSLEKTAGTTPTALSTVHFGNVRFTSNDYTLKESSIHQMGELLDYLAHNKSKKVTLVGMCASSENTPNYAMQRAKGVKDYLVHKSISPNRIEIQKSNGDQEFAGVKVYVDK